MEILIVSATFKELKGLLPESQNMPFKGFLSGAKIGEHSINYLVTGIGSVATAFHLGQHLVVNSYNLIINIGIAGTFRADWELGRVVHLTHDSFADFGAEDHDQFLDFFEIGLLDPNEFPFVNKTLQAFPVNAIFTIPGLEKAIGITVNKVHGNALSIEAIRKRYPDADVESLEGAAFFYACNFAQIPSLQIRAISNYIEPRNRENWQINIALENLWKAVREIIY